jgi:serine/threonine protein kinase
MATVETDDEQPLVPIGQEIGRYRVVEALGCQGLADRYLARAEDGSEHLLGVIPAQHPELYESIASLELERVRHPNVLRVREVVDFGKLPVVVTEVVRGVPLRDWLHAHGLPDADTTQHLFRGLLDGAQAIHAAGFVHRDLRPETILVSGTSPPQVRILDLGVATAVFKLVTGGRSVITSGSFLGQPHYWAPERARKPQEADPRADLFSLGCILYELYAGQGPFAGLNLYDCYHATLSGKYRPLAEVAPDAPATVQNTVQRLLQPDPAKRLQSAHEVMERLDLCTLDGDAPDELPESALSEVSPMPTGRRTPTPAPPPPAPPPPRTEASAGSPNVAIGAGVVVAGVLAAGAAGGWLG